VHETSPWKLLLARLSLKHKPQKQPLTHEFKPALAHQCTLQPTSSPDSQASGFAPSWPHDGMCLAFDDPISATKEDGGGYSCIHDGQVAKQCSTLHFASLFLLIKLFSKTATLLHLDKSHKRLKIVKLVKLAK
jgi:hypothetical protein